MIKTEAGSVPPLPQNVPGVPDRPRCREQYGVIIICADEATQQAVYQGLSAIAGAKLRVVVT